MYPQIKYLRGLEAQKSLVTWFATWSIGCYGNKSKIAAFTENKVNFSVQQPSQLGRNKTVLNLLRVIYICKSCLCQ